MQVQNALQSDNLDGLGDAELVELARQQNGAAFGLIMQRNNRRLFRVARAIVQNDSEAEDVVQEAYLAAFASLGKFRGEASLATWLTRITLNEALGRLRRQRPMVGLDVLDAGTAGRSQVIPFPNMPTDIDPERAAAHRQVRQLIEKAIDELPEIFRVVFVLRDVEELSIEATADALDLPPATVKTRLHRARRQLREALDAQLASALTGTFPFDGAHCQRTTNRVLERMGFGPVSTRVIG